MMGESLLLAFSIALGVGKSYPSPSAKNGLNNWKNWDLIRLWKKIFRKSTKQEHGIMNNPLSHGRRQYGAVYLRCAW